ncbi:Na(+)/H(+) exchange regulatory cofactor NHE-RF2-like [Branchiostoma floridae]|uniref:Na(+)/H(+) exchange regulatory cofactor NHE-RF2-like n=1 Tax=Branchiostoma floridae TaxID=7739 RepID=A0A9J7M5H7_BRAFL|nr:Na(+)/H(+) exchange regulatory cofactor NHE-RF2-like [Branchiostoma floridae]
MSSPLSPPRVCVLSKAGGREYGFHLHGEKGKHGQYVKSVDAGSPAEQSGLRPDDRVIEVNGVNIERETHQQVVIRIKENPMEVRLLVVDHETDDYYKKQGVTVKESMAAVTTPVAADQTPEPPVENGVDHPEPAPEPAPVVSQAPTEEPPAQRVAVPPHLAPRLCHIAKGDSGYGFNLHGEKGHRGQFIRAIDAGSPAEVAGLKVQDRLVEVNGENIESLKHAEVVGKIKEGGNETTLLVVDKESDAFFQEKGVTITKEYVGGTPGVNGDPVVETPPPTPPAVEEPVSVTEVSSAPPVNSPVSSPDTSSPELPPPPTPEETPAPVVDIPPPPTEEPEPIPEPVANSTPEPEPQSAPSPASSPSEDSGVGDFTIDLATARQKVLSKKKARPSQMNWQNKHEIFNNM